MAVRPLPEEEPSTRRPERLADRAATERLLAAVGERVEALRSARFRGEDPVVRPRRVRRVADALREGALAALAAERLGALLQFDDELLAPAEDVVRERLTSAYRSLAVWDLRAAADALDQAARFARFPEHQQRIALGWALHRLVGDLLLLVPGEDGDKKKQRSLPAVRIVRDLLVTLDQLPPAERDFYAEEAERLEARWREAAEDDRSWCVWALLRARVALIRGEGAETALAWLLRLASRAGLDVPDDDPDGLGTLLRRARAVFALLAGAAESEELRQLASAASPRDLFRAVVAALTAAWGEDALAATHRFALALYVPETTPAGEVADG
ncbi:MAG: hypothetical protein RMK01_09060 [Thermomicrobium sp.]|nr:hypothetical protein [Thermomicrobium sp.]